jgi:enamine deaminase RidA (YjgF/YER057c/UK114 family)
MVFVSGQLPIDASGNKLIDAAFEVQARQVLENVAGALVAAGTRVSSLVQVRVYLTDIARWPVFDAIYAAWAGASRPARTVVPVPALHHGLMIEIEVTAMIEPRGPHPRAPRSTRRAPSRITRGAQR